MRRWRLGAWIPVVAAVALGITGCDDPSEVTAEDLYGLWGGISMVFTSETDPGLSVDVVGTEGATYSLQLISGGTYDSHFAMPGEETVREVGRFEVSGTRLLLEPASGEDRSLTLEFDQSLLTLRESDSRWDFDGDGTAEPARLRMVLDRF